MLRGRVRFYTFLIHFSGMCPGKSMGGADKKYTSFFLLKKIINKDLTLVAKGGIVKSQQRTAAGERQPSRS